jgi:hypothetical protein
LPIKLAASRTSGWADTLFETKLKANRFFRVSFSIRPAVFFAGGCADPPPAEHLNTFSLDYNFT